MKIAETFKKMTKTRFSFFLVFLILSILCAFIIFGFSSSNAEKSLKQSNKVTDIIVRILEPSYDDLPEIERLNLYSTTDKVIRKTAHFLIFSLLGFLTYFCVGCIKYLPGGLFVQAAVSFPLCVVFAATDEIHQKFVSGRAGRLFDVGIDSCGVLFGTLVAVGASFVIKLCLNKKS